ncbi:MAG: FtsX-like permease family protein [Cytophagales bacterium]
MFKIFLKVAFRNFKRNLLSSSINVIGLTLGFISFLVLSLYVINEYSYDKWNSLSERTFRLTTIDEALGVSSNQVAITNPMMPEAIEEQLSAVEIATRVQSAGELRMEKGDMPYYVENCKFVEDDFFRIFDIKAYDSSFLAEFSLPRKMILAESESQRIYGQANLNEKQLLRINGENWEVIGTYPDIKNNFHLEINALLSITPPQSDSNTIRYFSTFQGLGMIGYAVLTEAGLEKEVEEQMYKLATENDAPDFWIPQLQPLNEVHLGSSGIIFDHYHANKGNKTYVNAMAIVAILVLIIAAFNFMNLSTAQAGGRAKETGMRKVLGSSREGLMGQFFTESSMLSVFSMLLAFLIFLSAGNYLNLGNGADLKALIIEDYWLIVLFFGIALIIGIFAGLYPALILSGFHPIAMLKGKFQTGKTGVLMRKSLVTIQFIASVAMIIITLLVVKQIDFLKNKDLGFNKEQILNIQFSENELIEKAEPFKTEVDALSFVNRSSYSGNMPGRGTGRTGVTIDSISSSDDETYIVSVMNMDEDFFDLMEIKIVEGRNFSEEMGSDEEQAILINEAMMESLGWKNIEGKKLSLGDSDRRSVIGLVSNFHFSGMREKIEPLMFIYNPEPNNNLNFKLNSANLHEDVSRISAIWTKHFPEYPFDYQFFDEEFNELFKADEEFASLIRYFTWISILLACMGLFGLSYFATEQKRKEIGIRKVLGSSVLQIITLLTKQFIWLILIASLIALPGAYYALNHWLSDFQYRIDLLSSGSLILFFSGVLAVVLISVFTIGIKSTKAALENPVNSLRDE